MLGKAPNITGKGYDAVVLTLLDQINANLTNSALYLGSKSTYTKVDWDQVVNFESYTLTLDANRNNALFGKSTNVQTPSIKVLWLIKS